MNSDTIETNHLKALVRKELRAAFPATRFAFRARTLSPGDGNRLLTVTWCDGPPADLVKILVRKHHCGDLRLEHKETCERCGEVWYRPSNRPDGPMVCAHCGAKEAAA